MKTKMIKLSVIAVFFVLLMGCTKDFDKINTNPKASADAPITNILAYCIRYTCSTYFDAWEDMNEPSTYGGHLAKKQYIDDARYVTRSTVVANNCNYLYITMNNLRDIRNRAVEDGLTNMENVAKIWEAVIMQLGTDRWRNLPSSEAVSLDQGIVAPKYDTKEEIYQELRDLLKEAVDKFVAVAYGYEDCQCQFHFQFQSNSHYSQTGSRRNYGKSFQVSASYRP
jgi:hypothetical protein